MRRIILKWNLNEEDPVTIFYRKDDEFCD